jgi:hypothetical protein
MLLRVAAMDDFDEVKPIVNKSQLENNPKF